VDIGCNFDEKTRGNRCLRPGLGCNFLAPTVRETKKRHMNLDEMLGISRDARGTNPE
jgi:hypothetical protein